MSEPNWINGVPTIPGVYWFTNGLTDHLRNNPFVFVLRVGSKGGSPLVVGRYGDGPLDMIYNKDITTRAKYCHIEQPKEWDGPSIVQMDSFAWVKTPENYLGIGILDKDAGRVTGTIVWLNHPINSCSYGLWIREEENYLYSLLVRPIAPISKVL